MKKSGWLGILVVLGGLVNQGLAGGTGKDLDSLNRGLQGKIIDFTHNHGQDRRIWSRSLNERRDLYVYVPPGYNPRQPYPLVFLLHDLGGDERLLLQLAPALDGAISAGRLPPVIVAAPDGNLKGDLPLLSPGSFFINCPAGDFEDYLVQDVWDVVVHTFAVRRERQAHVLAGAGMGGFAAFDLGIRHRDAFAVLIGVHPPLNLRWTDKDGVYRANFDPYRWGWRKGIKPLEPVGHFNGGRITLRLKDLLNPLFGLTEEAGQQAMEALVRENPTELVDRTGLRNGELAMYVAYGGKDEFNIDAQVESFLYLASYRGLGVGVGYDPEGRHDTATAMKLLPGIIHWLTPLLAPYSPPLPTLQTGLANQGRR